MMNEARKIYWSDEIEQSKMAMVLYTIIDGKIYKESKTDGWNHSNEEAGSLYGWDIHLYQLVSDPRFPHKI
jgi:hypothetical protein